MGNSQSASVPLDRHRVPAKWRRPEELNILLVLLGIALLYELLGWIFIGQSFLMNSQRITITVLQVSVVGIIAVGVTQVIITSGIDLSSGSVVAMTAMVSAGLAQSEGWSRALYPALTNLPAVIPISVGILVGLLAGTINGVLIAYAENPTVHRHTRHDGGCPRSFEVVH